MTQEAAAKKDTQKLQRAVVDGLEDVKAQDIQVFNTEHLSPLFERVIVATGSSNRQTKALASSVVDAVREAGFPKPRIEGEENGEWIIVDCGAAVAHIMQPAIRQYYNLEEIWGDKPLRLRLGAPKPVAPQGRPAAKKALQPPSLRRSSAAKTAEKAAKREADEARKAPARKSAKPAGKSASRPPGTASRKTAGGSAVKAVPARSAAARGAAGEPAPARKPAGKTAARKAPSKSPSRKA